MREIEWEWSMAARVVSPPFLNAKVAKIHTKEGRSGHGGGARTREGSGRGTGRRA